MKTLLLLFSFLPVVCFAEVFAPDRPSIPEIVMDRYLVASSAEYPALQTAGLATCIGVTVFDEVLHQGAMMHVSIETDIPAAIDLVLAELESRGSAVVNLQAQLHGGWGTSMEDGEGLHFLSAQMKESLLNELAARKVTVVVNAPLIERVDVERGTKSILDYELDLQTGAVYPYSETVRFSGGAVAQLMPQMPL